jgi:plastocyanin
VKRRLVLAITLCLAAAGCNNIQEPVNEVPVAAESPTPTASPSPTPPPLPVALEGPVNNTETRDLTASGASVSLDMQMLDFSFTPTFVKVAPGANVKLALKNGGTLADHTFTIDSLAVDRQLKPGATDEVVIQLPQSGAFRFYCRFHAERGMQGAFFFNPGDSISAVAMTPVPTGSSAGSSSTGSRRTSTRSSSRTSTSGSNTSGTQNEPGDLVIPDLEIGDMVPGGSIGGNPTPRSTQNAPRSSAATRPPQTGPSTTQGAPAKSGSDGAPSAPGAPGAEGSKGTQGS